MLVRLVPEQIGQGWDVLRGLIAQALPSEVSVRSEAMVNLLRSLLNEQAQLWVYYRGDERSGALAVIMSCIYVDPITGGNSLLIYAMSAVGEITDEDYDEGLDTLRSFAEGIGCKSIIAYVNDDRFVQRLTRIGGVKVSNLVRL